MTTNHDETARELAHSVDLVCSHEQREKLTENIANALRAAGEAPEATALSDQPLDADAWSLVIEQSLGGVYEIETGMEVRTFWVDKPVAETMTARVLEAIQPFIPAAPVLGSPLVEQAPALIDQAIAAERAKKLEIDDALLERCVKSACGDECLCVERHGPVPTFQRCVERWQTARAVIEAIKGE